MPCIGADYSHVEPMAKRLRESVIKTLEENGYKRPSGLFFGKRLQRQWDEAVEALEESLQDLLEVDATAKF